MCYGAAMVARRWSLAIHGGAGAMAREAMTGADQSEYEAGLSAALDAGIAVLDAGGSALDAVEAAVVALEDDPHFNAGRGSVFTHDGTIELDASIMDGRSRAAGAATGLTTVRNPVRLARAVMEHSPHVFVGGQGAEEFARLRGLETVDPSWFATDERSRPAAGSMPRSSSARSERSRSMRRATSPQRPRPAD
jgi:beta-aspartyl-peptidase (threonine type)